jgi:hypothetical protein
LHACPETLPHVTFTGDFQACASNLQSLVATLALCVTLGEELQLGLNARDQAVFDEQLVVLPEVGLGCRKPN